MKKISVLISFLLSTMCAAGNGLGETVLNSKNNILKIECETGQQTYCYLNGNGSVKINPGASYYIYEANSNEICGSDTCVIHASVIVNQKSNNAGSFSIDHKTIQPINVVTNRPPNYSVVVMSRDGIKSISIRYLYN